MDRSSGETSWTVRVSLQAGLKIDEPNMKDKLPLRGIRVHLSGSIPEEATLEEANGIRTFTQKFTAAILREGGTLIHGSHPSLMEPIREAGTTFVAADGPREALTLVRAYEYSTSNEQKAEIAEQLKFSVVHIIPNQPLKLNEPPKSLVPMREWMAERCDAVVAVGGRWYKTNRDRSGVPDELEEALRRGKSGFIVTNFGGAIAEYAKEEPALLSRLKNGLSEQENRQLAGCLNIGEQISKIVTQLKLLPLVRESIPSGRHFRILALDGGGLRGTFTAAVLAKWADMLDPTISQNLVKHFDLVAGTSTGAILAIGLSLGLAPRQILDFYRTEGPKIFPKDRSLRHWLKSKHDSKTLRELLGNVFGTRILSKDSCCRLVIPTVRAIHGEAEVIVTPHTLDRTAFRDISAVDAALASSAAPTYFDEALLDDTVAPQSYLDGGIWANNPILPAIAEAVRFLKIPLNRIDVLSIGTMGNEADFTKSLGKGKAVWAASSADLFFATQEHAAVDLANSLLSPSRHLRVNQQTPSEIKLDDVEAIVDMAQRGSNVGKDSFFPVRSRFLDGFYAADWKEESK
jgi:patatin-like phospholipase/acyl hydrolase